ncbi:hypothetical protein LZ30DRAFT_714992 [Colletotrichum cereale]|nr:hypothetical protein LZ30DRAFT_714992 [Colletotrichum cereale]
MNAFHPIILAFINAAGVMSPPSAPSIACERQQLFHQRRMHGLPIRHVTEDRQDRKMG